MKLKRLKRALSVVLSMSLCLGMLSTAAFAASNSKPQGGGSSTPDAQDYVYVYINVMPDKVTENEADDSGMPTFDAGDTDTALKEADAAASQAVKDFGDASAPVFDADHTLTDAVKNAEGNVTEELEDLQETTNPVYSEAPAEAETPSGSEGDTNETPSGNPEAQAEDPDAVSTEAPNADFANGVNDQVTDLNDEVSDAESKANEAKTNADDKFSDLQTKKAELDKAAADALGSLSTARTEAETEVKKANDAVAAIEQAQKDLQAEIDNAIKALEEKDPGDAPAWDEAGGQKYEDYKAAYDAWEAKRVEYNNAVKEIVGVEAAEGVEAVKGLLQQKQEELQKQYDDAVEAVKTAQTALTDAETALNTFNTAKGNYSQLDGDSDAIKAYNDAIAAYNTAGAAYDAAATDYNTAAKLYDDAVAAYNTAVDSFNTAKGDYNGKVTSVNDKVTDYVEAAEAYNEKVDAHNDAVNDWNAKKLAEQEKKVAISESLAGLEANDIQVYNTVTDKLSATSVAEGADSVASLTNDEIETYNKVVEAYNKAIEDYNKDLVQQKLKEVDNYFKLGQVTHTSENKNDWYTVGKIEVGTVFKDGLYDKNNYNLTNPNNQWSGFANNTLVTWTKDEDGSFTSADDNAIGKNNTALDSYYQSGMNTEKLEGKLSADNKLTPYAQVDKNVTNPTASVDKWVLVVTKGASGYRDNKPEDKGQDKFSDQTPCLHLNGYLYVEQLGKLALLQARADENKYQSKTEVTERHDKLNLDDQGQQITLSQADKHQWRPSLVQPDTTPADAPTWTAPVSTPAPTEVPELYAQVSQAPESSPTPSPVPTATPEPTPVPTATPEPTPVPTATPEPTPVPTVEPTVQPSEVIVDEPEVPLVETPEEVEIDEPEVPLDEIPEEIEIDEPEVPLDEMPEEIEIDEEEIPLADVPQTGDISILWYAVALFSVAGLMAVNSLERKQRKEDLKTALRRSFWR